MAQEILPAVKEFQRRIFETTVRAEFVPAGGDKLIDFCKGLVKETSGIILHPNHWVIQNAVTVSGEYLMCHRQNTMSLELSEYCVKCWKRLLSILDLLNPGITQSRANAQMQLATVLHLQGKELLSRGRHGQMGSLEECLVLLTEALKFFKNECPTAGGVVRSVLTIEKNISQILADRSTLQMLRSTVSSSRK
ncbi:unnamed protein product [Allacma fusca]|uniref:Uncharacterized protein n=1 Tax=Allacma fusca TaxID=39272 RepID=A0A8J2PVH0_9HEXA|nr:unnamed protein product [Allacma fusca]